MESVCEVVGFEYVANDEGEQVGCRIYGQRLLHPDVMGEGIESVRIYISTKYVNYQPQIGDKIVAITDQRGYVQRIVKF